MLVPDTNILLNAENRASQHHEASLNWLEAAGNGRVALAIPSIVLFGFVRIVTNPRLTGNAMTPAAAFAVCDAIRSMPAFEPLREGPAHWRIFQRIADSAGISGGDLTDAYLAAFAIEHDATFVTFDRGFARFPGLKVLIPAL
ncbi:type II toxin-antitoxin system VapC family toxin [Candidatus Amarobacter glycogenicus]|uniref:type II toxin-antitoxin system VapC family toxin n=1 Tax=Candidatus Amarobacter glycogenicus TaxID=3140699 RepID=UPI003136CAE2|nr:type II toxin-antitoxin system VapC family toxin [Dehalococcoidia bacterium]